MTTIQSLQCWRIVLALTALSIGAKSLNSLNLELENIGSTDLTALGTPNLALYNGTFELSVGGENGGGCNYTLRLHFNVNSESLAVGDPDFQGTCAPDHSKGNATDGLPWHAPRRNWLQFPSYVFDTTGFDHVSVDWSPCGRAPAGLRKPRYDLNFFTVTPEYRAFMDCEVFKTPSVCQYIQTSHLGRAHFSIPRLARDPQFLSNMPARFQPDPEFPEAFQHEGLTHYDATNIPETSEDWELPSFIMSTHDASIVSWRAMIPFSFFDGKASSQSSSSQLYAYQTMLTLPSNWRTSFDGNRFSIVIKGAASMCGSKFENAKEAQSDEYDIAFENDSNTTNITESSEDLIY